MDELAVTVHYLAIIVGVGKVIMTLLLVAVLASTVLNGRKVRDLVTQMGRMHNQFNSRMDQLLEAKRAEGVLEGEGGRGPAVGPAPDRPTGS